MAIHPIFESEETINVLNCISENIIIADLAHNLVWFNASARNLVQQVGTTLGVSSPDELIGKNILQYHRDEERARQALDDGPFPIHTSLIFGKHSASFAITPWTGMDGSKKGYLLIWHDETKIAAEARAFEQLVDELSTPVINTIQEETILVPIVGTLDEVRMQKITDKVLQSCVSDSAEFIVIDLSGVTNVNGEMVSVQLKRLTDAISLIGAKPIIVGLSTDMVLTLITSDDNLDVKTFAIFKQAMRYIMQQKGLEICKV